MTPSAEKLGLFLPEGLHQDMLDTAERLNTRKNPRGCVRLIYERAFRELVEALDVGEAVTFPAVRGAKDRVSVRLSKPLCVRIRRQTDALNLKLTDFAFTAIDRFLQATQETPMTRPAKTALALGKIDLEEKTTDLRLKLKGKLAVDLADYQRAFAQANDQSLELDQLVPHILAAFIDADKGFQAWRKAQPASS